MARTLDERFEEVSEDFLQFKRIPKNQRRHPRPDVCALIFLHEKLGGSGNMIAGAEHDEIRLEPDEDKAAKKLTDDDILYLTRCGVHAGEDGLAMFV